MKACTRWSALGVTLSLLLSCSTRDGRSVDPRRAIDVLRARPELSLHLSRAIEPRLDGARAVAAISARSSLAGDALRVELPSRADGSVRLSIAGEDDASLELLPLDLAPRALRIDERALVFEDARVSTDVVHFVEAGRYEESRVLRTADAPTVHRWSLRLGAAIADVRVREGLVEAIDRAGRVRLVQHRAFADDALGTRRMLDATLEGSGRTRTLTLSLDISTMVFPIVLDPAWTIVAPMLSARAGAAITLLADGRVLVAGGKKTPAAPGNSTAEVYDPKTNVWSPAGTLPTSPLGGPRTLYPIGGGHAVLVGQFQAPGSAVTLEWDGATTWSPLPSMSVARMQPNSIQLRDGRILVCGGLTRSSPGVFSMLSSGEVYDPVKKTWTPTSPLPVAKGNATLTLLHDGRVLVAGGLVSDAGGGPLDSLSDAELFDPATLTFTATAPLPDRRDSVPTVVLPSGDVDVVQGNLTTGSVGGTVTTRTIYRVAAGSWTTPTTLGLTVSGASLRLSDGRYLFVNSVDAVVHDPTADSFAWAGELPSLTASHAYVALADGRALVVGGSDLATGVQSNEAELWSQSPLGKSCSGDEDCVSNHCTDGVCCGVASCGAGKACGATGACKLLVGGACALASDCASGFCVDGACCNRACSGTCEACDDPFSLGSCKTIAGAPHGTRAACSDGGGNPCTATTCNGTDASACHLPTTGAVACGSNACRAGTEVHLGTCDGGGGCIATGKSCGAYGCGATACHATCATSADCAAGYWCSGSACVPAIGLGKSCGDPTACLGGLSCVDGVCCGSASCPAGASCGLSGHEGSCFLKQGAACAVDAECASGFCADGVCCDGKCDGQCEACDAKGSEGACTAISGAPHRSRARCSTDATNVCKSASCDGSERRSCAGLSGSDVVCQQPRCDAGTLTPKALCDGKGSCAAATSATCSGFTCADASACRTTCKDDGDCVEGFHCDGGKCASTTDTCSADGTQALPAGGAPIACAPFVCRAGGCLHSCATSDDCEGGSQCAFESKMCVKPSSGPGTASGGGCSTAGGTNPFGTWLLLGVVVCLSRRRGRALVASLGVIVAAASCDRPEGAAESRGAAAIPRLSPLERVRRAAPSLRAFGAGVLRSDARFDGGRLRVSLPMRMGEPLHLESARDVGVSLDIVSEDVRDDVRTEIVEGALVHEGALASTTILYAPLSDGAEEARILHDARAPTTLRLRLHGGAKIREIRVREERIEAVDALGYVQLGSAPMWAVDADGEKRALSVREIERGEHELIVEATLDARGLRFPIVVDPVWSATPSMKYARSFHTATTFADGRVMEIGGQADTDADSRNAANSAEIYDPTTNTWTTTSALKTGHTSHASVRVGSKVLVVSGAPDAASASGSAAELWDPTTGAFAATAPLPETRSNAAAALLPSGKVLVFGGDAYDATGNPGSAMTTFLFDPGSSTWSSTGSLSGNRVSYAWSQLADGSVLVAGGMSNANINIALSTVERYDPASGKWAPLAPMKSPRFQPAAIAFASGKKVLVAGGNVEGTSYSADLSTSEIYDVATNSWSAGPTMSDGRDRPLFTLLSNGRALIVGGETHLLPRDVFQVFDPTSSTFTSTGRTPTTTLTATLVSLPSGAALLAGGSGGAVGEFTTLASAYVFAPQPAAAACRGPDECTSGSCVDGVCCNVPSCAAGSTCAGAASPGRCTKLDAVACTAGSECATGFCIDGVCCESACSAQCAACDVPGNVGRCRPARGAPHGARTACSAAPSECGPLCDGSDTAACHPRSTGAPCGGATCALGKESHASTCDGAGACKDSPTSCGAYACGATTCKTTCARSSDCADGYACSGSACVSLPGKGSDCSGTGACGPGLSCVSGVCCGSASCGGDSVCPLGVGDCVKVDGAKCTLDADCQHGHCVDGFCCNDKCDGACGACDVTGQEGKCIAVAGKPHGARACPSDVKNPCSASFCNGADKSTCASYPGSELACRASTCVDGKSTSSAFCDAKGTCPDAVTSECGVYRCNADGTACRTRCTAASDCATSAWCKDGRCQPLAGTCTPDGTAVQVTGAGTVSCAPYLCRKNDCLTTCDTSEDCAPGAACDASSHVCNAGGAGAPPSSGCTTSAPSTTTTGVTAWLAIIAAAGLFRRTRGASRRARRRAG